MRRESEGKGLLGREIQGNQSARVAEACLRIRQSLDYKQVLQEVIDSARSLGDARFGALLVLDEEGAVGEFLTCGMSPEDLAQSSAMPNREGLLGFLHEVREPLRLPDMAGHPSSVGFPEGYPPMTTLLGVPILNTGDANTGDAVGNIYLAEKADGQEFTKEDEESLVAFAAHAAVVINNARAYEQERQAKEDLEALINIWPIGVMVFDAKSGDLLSRNEETKRIVGELHVPGYSLSELFEGMTLRTADGHDIPLHELPTAKALRSGKTVLAEEVVVHLPDGRAIHTLVNARPIYGQGGDAVSVVTTMQDITPLEASKRQRAELLSKVSRNLRTPLASIKGSTSTILNSSHPPDIAEVRQFLRIIDEQADHMRHLINDLLDLAEFEAGKLSVTPEPTNVEDLLNDAREAFLEGGATGRVQLVLAPDLPRIMADRERVFQVLRSLLSLASEHSQDIRMSASLEDLSVAVTVESAGAVLPADRSPHLSTGSSRDAEEYPVTGDLSEGLDLAVCRGIVGAHGGWLLTDNNGSGSAARFSFTIPVVDEIESAFQNETGSGVAPSGAAGTDRARILAIGGDPEGRRYIRSILVEAAFTPIVTGDADEVQPLIEEAKPHLVIVESIHSLDEGFALMERVREASDAPVIFVSGPGNGDNIGRAFQFGAADYVIQPFTPTELVTRINAALRRRHSSTADDPHIPFTSEDLTIDYAQRRVTVADHPVQLTVTEYRLLSELSIAAGQVLTYEQLLRRVWGPLYSTDTRIVYTYIKQLRSKLGDDAKKPKYIFTEPRVGYHMLKPTTGKTIR